MNILSIAAEAKAICLCNAAKLGGEEDLRAFLCLCKPFAEKILGIALLEDQQTG
jgi:hypothetical protein